MKYLEVEMQDGSVWAVPAEVIAKHRGDYYRKREGDKSGSVEMQVALEDHSVLIDWAENNMNWSTVQPHAIQVGDNATDYQEGWVNGNKRVVERKP